MRLFTAVAFVAAFFMSSNTLACQVGWAERDQVLAELAQTYGERKISSALIYAPDGRLLPVEVFIADTGATWTMIVTDVDGCSRGVVHGEAWQRDAHKKGSPS